MKQPQSRKRPSVMTLLRDLVPKRELTWREAERIAELQANRLREILGLNQAMLPEEIIGDLPRMRIFRDGELRVSGAAKWYEGRWFIGLNPHEPIGRQRFSLAHEFKHVLDHADRRWLYLDGRVFSPKEQAERLADYFAGCLLMPKRWVKRLFGERSSLTAMAKAFGVTPRAMHVRLSQLGLIEATPRCDGARDDSERTIYLRELPIVA